MNKKDVSTISIFLLASLFLFVPVSHTQNSQTTCQKFLEYLNDWTSNCVGDLNHLKLVNYTYKGEIKSEKNKSRVIEAIYSDKAPFVSVLSDLVISDTTFTDTDIKIQQKIYPNFEIVTVRQMVDGGKLTEDSIAMLKKRLYKNVGIGDGYLEMDWSYKGKKYRSLGIIPNDGIPVDPITSGLRTGGKTIINSRNFTNKRQ
ncbi:hypothetical protein [Bacteroides sp.]|uniref:hypothetical protein n=1 Tax=Bacteroides sp. TaxID=29523 RepID=UPI002636664D|nr:hypothetical protein [Bacteroides sp.]MDD3038305.1 hypothetical protein [Bacteroides sp.]